MGLFDRFKKRVQEVAEEVDSDALTADADSQEGKAAIEVSNTLKKIGTKILKTYPSSKNLK